ncbi:MAG: hypothetical protein IJD04_05030, partial [Desulfovibrionaceae bacterium]|nr:hypothetical protein [Desulfovibrionaceae bacterium]
AKEQNLFLNPAKISGTCGRLLCCLAFEQEGYEEFHRRCPKMSKKYITNRGVVKVLRSSIFRNTLSLLPEEGEEFEVTLDEWQAMEPQRQGQVQQPKKSQPAQPQVQQGEVGDPADAPRKESQMRSRSKSNTGGGPAEGRNQPDEPGDSGDGFVHKRQERGERGERARPHHMEKAERSDRSEKKDRGDRQFRSRRGQGRPYASTAGQAQPSGAFVNNGQENAGGVASDAPAPKEEIRSAGLSRFLAATGEEE